MRLNATIVPTRDLTPEQRGRMYALMQESFDGVSGDTFTRDLEEKPWTILLEEGTVGALRGFSTLRFFDACVEGRDVSALYSGDTIVQRGAWGAMALEMAWIRFAFQHADRRPDRRWYWFLVCKGYRTYRYLPVYFRQYHPCPGRPLPDFEQAVLDRLATERFGRGYDRVRGVVTASDDYRLKPGLSDIGERELRDPRIAFFQQRNPGWPYGCELACLVELSRANLKRGAMRLLAGGHA